MLKLASPLTLGELALKASAELAAGLKGLGAEGIAPSVSLAGNPETLINSLASAEQAVEGCLTFAIAPKYLEKAIQARASAAVVPPALAAEAETDLPLLVCQEPRLIFAVLLGLLAPRPAPVAGDPFFADRRSVTLGDDVILGPLSYIGRGVAIGRGTVVGPRVIIEDGVVIGEDCLIHPGAVLRWGVKVGNRCQIHCGSVIGDDGFGYIQLPDPQRGRLIHYKNEHIAGVVLEDDVEIGALTSIDRGMISDTVIGRGSKLDNHVQIGHNCQVGKDCIVVSQVGIGGHSIIGDRAFLLGQVGLGPGVTIGEDAVLTGQTGLGSGSIPSGRRVWSGTPARTNEESYKLNALGATQLPKVRRFFQALKKSSTFDDLKAIFGKEGDGNS